MEFMTWTKLPPLEGKSNPCRLCPPIARAASMDAWIAVGFGDAHVEKNGRMVYRDTPYDEPMWKFADAEKLAAQDPDNDWRVVLYGPLHGEVYQRHAPNEWYLIEKNEGFA